MKFADLLKFADMKFDDKKILLALFVLGILFPGLCHFGLGIYLAWVYFVSWKEKNL